MNIVQVIYFYCQSVGNIFSLGVFEGGVIILGALLWAYTVATGKKVTK